MKTIKFNGEINGVKFTDNKEFELELQRLHEAKQPVNNISYSWSCEETGQDAPAEKSCCGKHNCGGDCKCNKSKYIGNPEAIKEDFVFEFDLEKSVPADTMLYDSALDETSSLLKKHLDMFKELSLEEKRAVVSYIVNNDILIDAEDALDAVSEAYEELDNDIAKTQKTAAPVWVRQSLKLKTLDYKKNFMEMVVDYYYEFINCVKEEADDQEEDDEPETPAESAKTKYVNNPDAIKQDFITIFNLDDFDFDTTEEADKTIDKMVQMLDSVTEKFSKLPLEDKQAIIDFIGKNNIMDHADDMWEDAEAVLNDATIRFEQCNASIQTLNDSIEKLTQQRTEQEAKLAKASKSKAKAQFAYDFMDAIVDYYTNLLDIAEEDGADIDD